MTAIKRSQPRRRRYVLSIPNYSRNLDGPLHVRPAEEFEIPGRFRTKVGARKKIPQDDRT